MLKTIDLGGGREIKLSNRTSWLFEYRDQFGQDIVPVLMPALIGLSKGISSLAKEAGGKLEDISEEKLLEFAGSDALTDMGVHFSAFDGLTGILEIAWAMAKAADPKIPELREWIRQIEGDDEEDDEMPLVDVITPTVLKMMFTGVMTRKNVTGLQEAWKDKTKNLQPKTKPAKKTNSKK